jgi:hypothetical protein
MFLRHAWPQSRGDLFSENSTFVLLIFLTGQPAMEMQPVQPFIRGDGDEL